MATAKMTKEEVMQAVKKAREWAKDHFNDAGARSAKTPLDSLTGRPAMFCEFEGNNLTVTPSFAGQKLNVPPFHYTLKIYPSGKLVWQGKHPIWDTPMPELVVEDPSKTDWRKNQEEFLKLLASLGD